MTDWSFDDGDQVFRDQTYIDQVSLPRKIFARTVPVLAAMSFSALVALRIAGGLAGDLIEEPGARLKSAAADSRTPGSVALAPEPIASSPAPVADSAQRMAQASPYGDLFAPEGAYFGSLAVADAQTIGPRFSPLQSEPIYPPDAAEQPQVADAPESAPTSNQQVAEAVATPQPRPQDLIENAEAPVPPARPAELVPRHVAEAEAPRATESRRETARAMRLRGPANVAQSEPRSFFDKLFGSSEEKGPQLAYASPDGGALRMSRGSAAATKPVEAEGGVAVYDISSATVYLPSGEKLEAHSGLGPYYDDPEHVHLRMRGSTPPATYNLTLRESMFHGVQALRLTPIDSNVHGRNGLLAHSFMLGKRGDSNGCVSFRNYRAFLEAYMRGEVRKLRVVASR